MWRGWPRGTIKTRLKIWLRKQTRLQEGKTWRRCIPSERCSGVDTAATSFVLGHYVKNFRDVLKIGWLPVNEKRDLNLLKSCFKALHNVETWAAHLIIKQEYPKELRSSNSIRLVVPTENDTFQGNASKLFNNLPETIRNSKDYRALLRLSRNFLRNRIQND